MLTRPPYWMTVHGLEPLTSAPSFGLTSISLSGSTYPLFECHRPQGSPLSEAIPYQIGDQKCPTTSSVTARPRTSTL
jgi:hypothetical protein